MSDTEPRFQPGQTVQHQLFDYRGVIVRVDRTFKGTDEWYEAVARSRPPRDKPWYHVLVHGSTAETYVAERNLELDTSKDPIAHPLVDHYFSGYRNGVYLRLIN